MSRIENTVFISYRRSDVYTALAVYQDLKTQGYDVFFDYRSISSGDFEQIITSNIRARAHFLLILTPTALDRLNEPGDWLRREIEIAIEEKRNIIPLFFKGFRFGSPSISDTLTGKLQNLSRYNGLNVHEDYFDEAMQRLRNEYLNRPLDTVLHPVSNTVQQIVKEEKIAADKALEQIEDVKELVKQADTNPIQLAEPEPIPNTQESTAFSKPVPKSPEQKKSAPNFNARFIAGIVGGLFAISLCIWGSAALLNNFSIFSPDATRTTQPTAPTPQPTTNISRATESAMPLATETISASTFTPVPTSTVLPKIGEDGMILHYVPAGEFTMGSDNGEANERPQHTVILDDFWIDQTEVTNGMYAECVYAGACSPPASRSSAKQPAYYGNAEFNNYPVISVSWEAANAYCTWVNRRLPTEAEWEKAARGTDGRRYPWGSIVPTLYLLNYYGYVADTTEVGKYSSGASPYGALDMAGNVSEWVADWYDANYYGTLGENASNPQGPTSGQLRVLRGGSWGTDDNVVRSAFRSSGNPRFTTDITVGFRCAMSATP